MEMEGPWDLSVSEPENTRLYNGKELDKDFGLDWYHYGFRMYDPAVGRFTGVDPISDKFPWVNVYNYAENEPIANIDLHGLQKLKATFNIAITQGAIGVEGKIGGSKEGAMLYLGTRDLASYNASAGGSSINNIETNSEGQILKDESAKLGVSGGAGVGGSVVSEALEGDWTKHQITESEFNTGPVYIKGTDEIVNGETVKSENAVGVQAGASVGLFFLGLEVKIALEYIVENPNNQPPQPAPIPTPEPPAPVPVDDDCREECNETF